MDYIFAAPPEPACHQVNSTFKIINLHCKFTGALPDLFCSTFVGIEKTRRCLNFIFVLQLQEGITEDASQHPCR